MIERLAIPIRLDPVSGRLAVIAQDSDADIEQCIRAIFDTRPGDREDLPEMGVPDDTFAEQPLDVQTLLQIVEKHEPRAAVLADTAPDALDRMVVDLNLRYRQQAAADGTDPRSL